MWSFFCGRLPRRGSGRAASRRTADRWRNTAGRSGRHQETQHYIALLREQANVESGEALRNDLTHKEAVGLVLGLFQIAVDLDTQEERQRMQRTASRMAEALGLDPEIPGAYL